MPGLNVLNLLTLSDLSKKSKPVWMDPSLWGTLPDAMVELILAHLPIPELLPMRAVCKKWNTLLRAPRFLTSQRALTVQCPSYVLTLNEPALNSCAFSFFQQHSAQNELYYLRSSSLYCPVSCNWFDMSLSCLPIRDFYVTSVASGLLCFVGYKDASSQANSRQQHRHHFPSTPHREVVVGVCNPATRTWQIMPRWGEAKAYDLPVFVAMVVDNKTSSYRVVLIDHDRNATWTYHSLTLNWTETDSVPNRHNFPYYDRCPSEAVVVSTTSESSNQLLVCASECKTGISTFDMDAGEWESYHVFLPGLHSNVHLVQHHGRILMISRVMKQKYEGSDRVQISELDPKGLRVTTAMEEVPLGPSKQFLDHFKVCALRSYQDSEGLCFVSVTTGERWLYDMDARFWHILPSSPGSKSKSMAAYGGFSIHLRVDILP